MSSDFRKTTERLVYNAVWEIARPATEDEIVEAVALNEGNTRARLKPIIVGIALMNLVDRGLVERFLVDGKAVDFYRLRDEAAYVELPDYQGAVARLARKRRGAGRAIRAFFSRVVIPPRWLLRLTPSAHM